MRSYHQRRTCFMFHQCCRSQEIQTAFITHLLHHSCILVSQCVLQVIDATYHRIQQPPNPAPNQFLFTMVRVINSRDEVWIYSEEWIRVLHAFNCTCDLYTFHLECGHSSGAPISHKCRQRLSRTGVFVYCYHPARTVNVYSVVIWGRCG